MSWNSVPPPIGSWNCRPAAAIVWVSGARQKTNLAPSQTSLNEVLFVECAQALAARSLEHGRTDEERVTYAKKATLEVPTGSDQEIKVFLAKQSTTEGEKPDPNQITTEQIKEFRDKELPELRELSSGRMTKEQWAKKQKTLEDDAGSKQDLEESGVYRIILVAMSFGLFGIFYLIAGVGAAYKTASGEDRSEVTCDADTVAVDLRRQTCSVMRVTGSAEARPPRALAAV